MSSSATNNATSEDAISMLTALGFSADMASEALQVCGGNLEAAANYLLTQQQQQPGAISGQSSSVAAAVADAASSSAGTTTASSGDSVQMIHGPISQYSVENGRSACTCMALKAAEDFLKHSTISQQQQEAGNNNPVEKIDASFLQNVVLSGVAAYQEMAAAAATTLSSSDNAASSAEHLSAEEVMLKEGLFPGLRISGEIRQGLLSQNRNDQQGLKQILLQSYPASSSSSSSPQAWGCFLITKPPETVLVCLPPPPSSSSNTATTMTTTTTTTEQTTRTYSYVLIDTHPRPQQFHAENAYARIHATLDDLVHSLESIFPVTELGPDIPPLMAAMYNSFDVYSLSSSE